LTARWFVYASSATTVIWVAAAVIDWFKMVQVVVSISGGHAYAYASAAGYVSTGGYTTQSLTTSVVINAYNSRSNMAVVSSFSGGGYGIANMQYSLLPAPTSSPTEIPSLSPSAVPTIQPSPLPTFIPSLAPSDQPSASPSSKPSSRPSSNPTVTPTSRPSAIPTTQPSRRPTRTPSITPTATPSMKPVSASPTRPGQSLPPTSRPTFHPTEDLVHYGSTAAYLSYFDSKQVAESASSSITFPSFTYKGRSIEGSCASWNQYVSGSLAIPADQYYFSSLTLSLGHYSPPSNPAYNQTFTCTSRTSLSSLLSAIQQQSVSASIIRS